jgi:hypothetical protein
MTAYHTHEEAIDNCPAGSHIEYQHTNPEEGVRGYGNVEPPYGWRWCVVTSPPSTVTERWVPTEPVTLEAAVKIADEWTPGCGMWAAFDNSPQEPKHYRWVWNACALLAIAQDRGNVDKIAYRRRGLELAIESWIEAGRPTEPAPEIEPGVHQEAAPEGLSMAAKCAIGVGVGLVAGHMLRGHHGHHGHSALGRAVTYAAVSQIAKPAFAGLFKAATR